MIMSAEQTDTVPDSIEREILIAAPLDVVWPLVSEPGWWINEGEIRQHTIEPAGDRLWKVTDIKHGEWLIEVVDRTEQRSISFRWHVDERAGADATDDVGHGDQADDALRTLVRFTLDPVPDGTVVRVVESGFAAGIVDAKRRSIYDDNSEGWTVELTAAKTYLEKCLEK
jgi:uncharacterized protein YndB with AHSA1/START domain